MKSHLPALAALDTEDILLRGHNGAHLPHAIVSTAIASSSPFSYPRSQLGAHTSRSFSFGAGFWSA